MIKPLNVILIDTIAILMMSTKLSTSGFLKKNLIKGYDVIIYGHDIMNKVLSHDSNYM